MRTYCAASHALMRDTLGKLKTGPAVRELPGNPAAKCLSGKTPAARFSDASGAPADTPEAQTFTGLNVMPMPRVFSAASNAG